MKRLAKLTTLLAGALAGALMLSACGGADPADTAAPTVAITDDVTGSTATGAVTFTFTFNEEVKDFTAEDVTVTGGDKASTVTKASATVYTLVVTPTTNSEGTISVSIAANKLADMANNQNAVVSSVTQGYNTKVSGVALNFEADGLGASFTWSTFENDTQPGVEIVSNPASSGINTSAKVAKFTSLKNGKAWAGFESKHGTDFPAMKLSMSNAVVKIMVYKSVISDVGIKFAAPDSGSTGEIKVPNTKINQWEELTFDFSGVIGGVNDTIDQIILYPDFGARNQDNVSYVDNITFSAKVTSAPLAPTTAPSTPTANSANVISLFSNAYTNTSVDTFRPDWSNVALTELKIAGTDIKKYSGLGFVVIEAKGANSIDATTMTHVNFDVWTPNATSIKLKLVDFGANNAYQGNDDSEHEVSGTPEIGKWNTVKLPLSGFAGLTAKNHLSQFVFSAVAEPAGSATIFVTNIYFSKEAVTAPTAPTTAADTPTVSTGNVISLFSNAYTNVTVDTWRPDWTAGGILTDIQVAGNDTKKYAGLGFVVIEAKGANAINATSMTHFNIDVWTADATTFKVKLVDWGADNGYLGGDDTEHELTFTPTKNGWNTYKLPLSDFTGLARRDHLSQIVLSAVPAGSASIFIDNVYFSK